MLRGISIAKGYTLLEILVVLVIISIVAGMAVLTIGHNDNKQLQAFTQELTQTLTLAEEQALLQPATLGLVVSSRSFRFYEYRPTKMGSDRVANTWEALQSLELGKHAIPSNIEVRVQIANQTLPVSPESSENNSLKRAPALLISSNGTITPFKILIGKKNEAPRYEIIGAADGSVKSRIYPG